MDVSFNDAPCLYFATSGDGLLREVNNTLCRQLQYSREELLGQKADVLFTVATKIFQQTHFFPLLKMQGSAAEIFITLRAKNGDAVPVLVNAQKVEKDDENLFVYTGIVVHNRQKFEDELLSAKKAAESALRENTALQEAKAALQSHSKLLDAQMSLVSKQSDELRQFSRVITHDLQEPLRKLFVFTDRLQQEECNDKTVQNVRKIRSTLEQMRLLVSGLQRYIWLTEAPAKTAAVDLSALLDDVKVELQDEHQDQAFELSAVSLPRINGDAEQLRFLFLEIFSNAVRFRKPDSALQLEVTAGVSQQNSYRALPEKFQYMPFLKVQIRDNGTGFDDIYKDQVFDLFRRLHAGSGRGVGLSLCKKIMENHDGVIRIDSRAGEGTVVSLFFPYETVQQPVVESGEPQ